MELIILLSDKIKIKLKFAIAYHSMFEYRKSYMSRVIVEKFQIDMSSPLPKVNIERRKLHV